MSNDIDTEDIETIFSRTMEQDIKDALDNGTLDIKINGKKVTGVNVAIDDVTGAIVITNDDGDVTELIVDAGGYII